MAESIRALSHYSSPGRKLDLHETRNKIIFYIFYPPANINVDNQRLKMVVILLQCLISWKFIFYH